MTVAVIIPARYDSTRFPGKPLCPLKGKPLIQHVYENSKQSRLAKEVIVATDSETIFERVLAFGGKAVMTDKNHPSGTDRIAEVAASLDYDIIVNVQGDEPLIRPEMIDDVITALDDTRASIGTLIKKIEDPGEIIDYNVVKVVFDKEKVCHIFFPCSDPISGSCTRRFTDRRNTISISAFTVTGGMCSSPLPVWSRQNWKRLKNSNSCGPSRMG